MNYPATRKTLQTPFETDLWRGEIAEYVLRGDDETAHRLREGLKSNLLDFEAIL